MLEEMRWPYLFLSLVACGTQPHPKGFTTSASAPTSRASAELRFATTESTTQVTCPDAAAMVDGTLVCPAEARAQALTILELADAWTPRLFAPQPDGSAPVFRATYLALAADKDLEGKPLDHSQELAELYGVVPSLAIVRQRLAEDARHACHAAIDSTPIALLDKPYAQDHKDVVKVMGFRRVALEKQLEAARARRKLPDLAALATVADKVITAKYAAWKTADGIHRGLVAAQRHLVCEGYLAETDADGSVTWRTSNAVELFQRRNFLMPNERLDAETRAALALDSRELDFRLALRILRERVVDATGLIEDGTASGGPQPILGRMIDPAPMRRPAVARSRCRTARRISSAPPSRRPRVSSGGPAPPRCARSSTATRRGSASRSRCRRCPPITPSTWICQPRSIAATSGMTTRRSRG